MNYTFVIGLERCGTHSISNLLARSCLVPAYVRHEPPPYLCYEAAQAVAGENWLTPELEARVEKYRSMSGSFKFVCEANHRLGLVAKYFGDHFPDAKFILMVRDPVKTLVSRVATLAHWPEIIDRYPKFYRDKIKKIVPTGKDVFNTYRPRPRDLTGPLHEIYLWEWVETYRVVREQIGKLNHVLVCETKEITNSVDRLLEFVGKDMFDPHLAAVEAKKRVDSVYEHGDKHDTIEYAWDMFGPLAQEIKERIRKEFPGDQVIERITA